MRISRSNVVDTSQMKNISNMKPEMVVSAETTKQVNEQVTKKITVEAASTQLDSNEETKNRVQEAVKKMNEMLEVNESHSKFMYHEGLDRYYVTIVDRETEEVVKEIPPKKLLDAFYEMQKMLGMIVDERI